MSQPQPPKRENIQAALEVCERATNGPWKHMPQIMAEDKSYRLASVMSPNGTIIQATPGGRNDQNDVEYVALTRDPQIGYEALLREHLRLMDALKLLRAQACSLGDFLYGAVRECSQDMVRGIDEAMGGAPAQEKEQAK